MFALYEYIHVVFKVCTEHVSPLGTMEMNIHFVFNLDIKVSLQSFPALPSFCWDRLVGLVVASASGAEDTVFESRSRRDFSRSSHTRDLKIGTPVATLPGAWRYRVSAGTVRPGVSIL